MKPVQENIELMREDGGTYTLKPVKGDYTGRLNYVTFKRDKTATSKIVFEKSSVLSQVRCTYNVTEKKSTFEFDYLPEDTRPLGEENLVFDVCSISTTDPTDIKTPIIGYCKIIGDVRNSLSEIPDDPSTVALVDLTGAEEYSSIRVVGGVPVPVSIAEEKNILGLVIGKGLSEENYTVEEKNKLANVAENANNYAHPINHPPSIIAETDDDTFISQSERTAWNLALLRDAGFTAVPQILNNSFFFPGE
jgi:hypothetical protein